MDTDISIIKIILVLYLIMGASLTQPLLSKQWIEMVEENRIIKHIIGLLTLIVLVTLTVKDTVELNKIILYSLGGYLLFIFSTKMDIQINIIIMTIVLMAYFYERHLRSKELIIKNDNVLSEEEKNNIINTNQNKKTHIFIGVAAITILGMFLYSNKKEIQYGGGYNLTNFLLY
jgi:hypothetical protein